MKIFILGLLLIVFCNSSAQTNTVTGISKTGDKYIIDTNAILENENLPTLIKDIESGTFTTYRTKDKIPKPILKFLRTVSYDKFSIANPGQKWQSGCVRGLVKLPSRQLKFISVSQNICIISYYSGGLGKSRHLVIIKFNENNIVDFWTGRASNEETIEGTLKFIKENIDKHWGLNTNLIII